ncbi:MAG: sigma-54 interaction domain-containing protein [Wenzhouxiangellaceae bacterium]
MPSQKTDRKMPDAKTARASPRLIGESLVIQSLKKSIERIAPTDEPVLITGETGTGKELVARRLHARSKRAEGPFVAVNCPALPAELFQAEVFGYEKGAFTGADRRNAGRIDAAHGGTLFLDEIGDLPMDIQAVLLRFLQEGIFERLGSVTQVQADVRILAATNVDLKAACRTGRFREDLYYRLNALHLHVPPLRNRGGDVRLLAQHFIDEYCTRLGLRPHVLSEDAIKHLCSHGWPGNVRELHHNVLQAVVMTEQAEIGPRELGLAKDSGEPCREDVDAELRTLHELREEAERAGVRRALCVCGGDVRTAARRLGISRAHLYRLIKRQDLEIGSS